MMIEHGSDVLDGADLIVAVPLHWRRRRQRGFNQAADLARGLGLPVRRALRRVRHTTPQVELPAEDRQSNIQGAFAVRAWPFTHSLRPESACSLADATIVLVDDVTTTGATLVACARTLRMAGAREIRALTAARAESAPRAARPR